MSCDLLKLQTPWLYSASELYRPSGRRLSSKLVSTFADRGCRVVSAIDTHGRILSRYFSIQVAPQLSSRDWVDPVPDPLLLTKSGSAGNRTRDLWICSQELWPLDHRGGVQLITTKINTVFALTAGRIPLYQLSNPRRWSRDLRTDIPRLLLLVIFSIRIYSHLITCRVVCRCETSVANIRQRAY
jgi:hypothetical protein